MYLYVFGAFDYNDWILAVKIGVSENIAERVAQIQTGQFCEIKLLAAWKTNSRMKCFHVEKTLHHYYAKRRMRGEWFRRGVMRDIVPLASDLIGSIPCSVPGVSSHLKEVQDMAYKSRELRMRRKEIQRDRELKALQAA